MRRLLLGTLFLATAAFAANPPYAPDRHEGEGPFQRLIIRGATVIDGTGAPAIGPVDIVIEGNRIKELRVVGAPNAPIKPAQARFDLQDQPPLRGGKRLTDGFRQ
jgi:hypothetical protein